MKILSAENNISYTANNACKIYIIKQVPYEELESFKKIYASLLSNDYGSVITKNDDNFLFKSNLSDRINPLNNNERNIKLTPLITFPYIKSGSIGKEKLTADDYNYPNEQLYTQIWLKDAVDRPVFGNHKPSDLYFLTSLFELRNCPLLDFSKFAFVFQIDGQSKGGLVNVVSFNTNFSVNGQSSAELILNNKDFLYNFKNFDDKTKYNTHLKSYFDTNDIIIIRYQRKNTIQDSLFNSFKNTTIDYLRDPYIGSDTDPFTTIFTGYINDINNAFSFTNGQQTVTLACTGPSKKLTWTRYITQQAPASKDSYSAITPISAYKNIQTADENGKISIENSDVINNLVVRTYSGLNNIPSIKEAYDNFTDAFDKSNSVKSDMETEQLKKQIEYLTDPNRTITASEQKTLQNLQKQLNTRADNLRKAAADFKEKYLELVKQYFKLFTKKVDDEIHVIKHTFLPSDTFGDCPSLFVIKGTDQPAYQWAFENWSSLFKSDYSTVYQFIKGIADDLQFNFYDDPYGTIHFEVADLTLMHLHKDTDPNNLTQITSFSETQNTENIANIQVVEAKYIYSDINMDLINNVIKDYASIKKYGEKMMQPFSMPGLTNISAVQYAGRQRMSKYNRKALSNIRVSMNGEPNLKLGKYAYIKSLRKLFYIESYSHSYNAGGEFTTSLNGTYTREILAYANNTGNEKGKSNTERLIKSAVKDSISLNGRLNLEFNVDKALDKINENTTLNNQLSWAFNVQDILDILQTMDLQSPDILSKKIYGIYVENWNYPKDNYDLELQISTMYTPDNVRQCFLDDFFWALPFNVEVYKNAKTIQDEQLKKQNQYDKTIKAKTSTIINKVTNKTDKKLSKRDIGNIINPEGPSKGVELEVDLKVKSIPNIPMVQRLNFNINTSLIKNTIKDALKQAAEEQKIIDNGGTIIKGI